MRSRSPLRNIVAATFGAILAFAGTAHAGGANLFVSEQFGNQVLRFNDAGVGSVFVSVHSPQGLAFDAAGNLYVADFEDSIVFQVSGNGRVRRFVSGGAIGNPSALAFDSAGNLYVGHSAHPPSPGIIKVAPDGTKSSFATQLEPNGLAFDSAGNLFATENRTNVILKFAPDGTRTTFATGFSRPEDLAFDSEGNLFVSDILAGIVYKIAPDGTRSTFAAGLTGPGGLAIDEEDNVFVADYSTSTIFQFAPDGTQSTFASGVNTPFDLVFPP